MTQTSQQVDNVSRCELRSYTINLFSFLGEDNKRDKIFPKFARKLHHNKGKFSKYF